MAKEVTYTPAAVALGKRADELLERIMQRFSTAQTPDPEWAILNTAEMNKRMAQKLEAATATNGRELRGMVKELDAAIEQLRKDMNGNLYPQNTFVEREEARYAEEKAYRVVRALGVLELGDEYATAMKDGLVTYGSYLIEWAERFLDKEAPGEAFALRELKRKHVEATGIQPFIDSQANLAKKKEAVEMRLRMIDAGYSKDLKDASTMGEMEAMLRVSGIPPGRRSRFLRAFYAHLGALQNAPPSYGVLEIRD